MNSKVLIMGANGALGQALTHRFASAGWDGIGLLGPSNKISKLVPFPCYPAIPKGFRPHAVVCAAGAFAPSSRVDDLDCAAEMWFANVKPALQAAGVAFQGEPRSRLVLIGASAVQSPIPADIVHYGMAKSQVAMLAETLSLSLNVLLVLPSTMDTPKNRKAMPGADFSKWLSTDAVAIAIEEWCKLAPDKPGFTVRSM